MAGPRSRAARVLVKGVHTLIAAEGSKTAALPFLLLSANKVLPLLSAAMVDELFSVLITAWCCAETAVAFRFSAAADSGGDLAGFLGPAPSSVMRLRVWTDLASLVLICVVACASKLFLCHVLEEISEALAVRRRFVSKMVAPLPHAA